MSDPFASVPRVEFADPQVNLYAENLDSSLRFYRDVLGFVETFRVPRDGATEHVELRLDSLRLGLATFDALERRHGIRSGPGPARVEIGLGTDDVDGAYVWATSRGARSVSAPYDFLEYMHAATVADPDGNRVVFYARRPALQHAPATARPSFRNHLFNLYVERIEPAREFYGDLLGFRETFRVPPRDPPEHVELELGALNLGLSTREALRRDHGLDGGGGPPRAELVVWVRDVDRADAWIRKSGARSLSPPHDFAGVLRAAWVADPDGNPVQMVARRDRP